MAFCAYTSLKDGEANVSELHERSVLRRINLDFIKENNFYKEKNPAKWTGFLKRIKRILLILHHLPSRFVMMPTPLKRFGFQLHRFCQNFA